MSRFLVKVFNGGNDDTISVKSCKSRTEAKEWGEAELLRLGVKGFQFQIYILCEVGIPIDKQTVGMHYTKVVVTEPN